MTFLYVNTGTSANKGDGDSLRTAFNKINLNFAQLTAVSTSGAQVVVGLFPPVNPEEGAIWWNTANGLSYVYYTDLNSSQWVSFTHIGNTAGTMLDFPANPSTGTNYVTTSGITYTFNGVAWDAEQLGIQGIQGRQGIQGTQGLQGAQGTQGVQGLQGAQGTQGVQGLQGAQGTQGVQGDLGEQGIQGIQGAQGTTGFQGLQGILGIQGTDGNQGIQGMQGLQGVIGSQGLQGLQGADGFGSQGIQGIEGSQGLQGLQGLDGTGTQGVQGIQGTQGTQGIQGIQGISGTTADQELNTTSNVTFASVTTPFLTLSGNFAEKFSSINAATGVVVHDCTNGSLFNHTGIAGTFTVNVTNIGLNSGFATNLVLILNQGSTAYLPTEIQISGTPRPINWQGGAQPIGNALKKDLISFSVLNNGGVYTVFGQLVSFG